jgi:large subunit ribosomal protein L25
VSESKLVATPRTDFGKGAARRTRRAGLIPAVLYGHGTAPVHVSLPGHQTYLALKHASNPLFEIELDGATQLALAKDVQRDPMRAEVIEHLDLLIVNRGEQVSVDIPVHLTGEPAGGAVAVLDVQQLSVEADATAIPDVVEVSVEGLEAGSHITAGAITLPGDATLTIDPETVVVTVTAPQVDDSDADAEAALADADAASETAADEAAASDTES